MKKEEIWLDVKDFPYYMISNFGRIKSLRFGKERIMKPSKNNSGYFQTELTVNKKSVSRTIHQMVAVAFLNHVPCGLELVINHKDKDKTNNHVDNLEIITNRKNTERNSPFSVSKYVGVGFHKQSGKWRARIRIGKKEKHLGLFDSELEASEAYQKELTKI